MKASKLIIFDLDGTLLDSKADISHSMNRTLAKYGLPAMDADFVWKYLGDGALYLVNRCFSHFKKDAPDGAVEFFLKDYQFNSLMNTRFYKGVNEMLLSLQNKRKAVLTNKLHEFSMKIIQGLGSAHHFEYILGRGSYRKKPDPEGIFIILEKLSVKPDDAVMIGDTTIDLEAGERAGIRRVGVTWGVHDRATLESAKPDAIVDEVSAITDLFNDTK